MRNLSSRLRAVDLKAIKVPKIPKIKLEKDSYLAVALAFLLGRTVLAGSLAPFGPAFYAGLRPLGSLTPLLAAASAVLGSLTLRRWDLTGYQALAVVLITLLIRPEKERRVPPALDAILAGAVVAVSRGIAAAAQNPTTYAYISALLEGLCAVVVATLTRLSFSPDRDKAPAARQRGSEALLVVTLLSLGGLHGVTVFNVEIAAVMAMGCTLATGFAAGPGAGAIAGLAGGLIVALTGNQDPALLGILGASGLLAGIGGWFGKLESVLGFMSAGLLMSLYANAPGALAQRLLEQAVSCAAILFVTPRTARLLAERFPVLAATRTAPPRPASALEPPILRTAAVAHALMEMGEMLSEVSASFAAAAVPQEAGEQASPATSARSDPSLVKQVAERVCRDCESRNDCWEDNFGETYEAFSDLTRKMQVTGQLAPAAEQPALVDRCPRAGEVVAEMNHYQEISRLERRIRSLYDETKDCLSFQYRCLGKLLAPKVEPIPEAPRPKRQKLKITVKGGTVPAEGTTSPGDMWVKYDLSPGRCLTVLVDGMGKGEAAAKQSKETIEILKSLLDCGLDYDSCVSFLNSALFLSCRPDSFVAVDCLLVDQDTERAYFHKLGAPPSFIRKRDGNVLVVRGSRPPAGAMSALPCFSTSEPVAAGDEIYMVSDGIFRSSPVPARSEHLLVSRLRRLKEGSLDLSVRTLMGYGQRAGGAEPPDDVTVVGVRVERV